ncbi:hypothetical protein Scep_004599 [Stephania cephalantha]|uniref:Uncharacterized protein n=1 Tax=Stephania cephalantha TaxID=152367 RepID=A0AAP0KV83_9MAGN
MLDVSQDLSIQLSNAIEIIGTVGKHICTLANCFKHEAEVANRRMNVVTELMKLSGLSHEEIIKVGRKIALNQLETDFFL